MKNLCKAVLFLGIGMGLLLCIQSVLTPKWWYPNFGEDPVSMLREYHALDETTDIQAFFLGTSHVVCGVDPMGIYQQSGIVTYNLASSNQRIEVSYYMLEKAFQTQQPQFVFLDASTLFLDFFEPAYRYILDYEPFSLNKARLAAEYASHYSEEKRLGAFVGAFLPIYQYHERWSELTSLDFERRADGNLYRKGHYITATVSAAWIDVPWMNWIAETNSENIGWTHVFQGGEEWTTEDESSLYAPCVSDNNIDYLQRIRRLCEENGAELKLFKVPAIYGPQSYSSAWTQIRSSAIKELAEEQGLEFLDLLYDVDLGIDWAVGTPDAGYHLNHNGAKKVTTFLADYLENVCGLTGVVSPQYEEDLPLYNAVCQVIDLQHTRDLATYLSKLSQMEHVTVFLSVSDDMMTALSQEDRARLNAFGLRTDFDTLSYSDAYMAVVEDGVNIYEASSNRKISHAGKLKNGASYSITSSGWLTVPVPESKILIDGVNYSRNQRGINIVAYDNVSGQVLDSVTFDTWNTTDQSAKHGNIEVYLREYEQWLMEQDYARGIR